MIEKKIKVLKDHTLKTVYGSHFLSIGEVKRVRFKNKTKFEELKGFGFFEEAPKDEEETKLIPIIPPIELDEEDDISVDTVESTPPKRPLYKEVEISVVHDAPGLSDEKRLEDENLGNNEEPGSPIVKSIEEEDDFEDVRSKD